MIFAFILSLFTATAVFASHSSSSIASSLACTQELEGIVYVPKNCAYNYLKSINKVLKAQSPLFWNNPVQAKSAIDSFKATYGVLVAFIDAMGNLYPYPGAVTQLTNSNKASSVSYQRSCALGEGFSSKDVYPSNPDTPVSTYMSVYWNVDGQMYTVAIALRKYDVPAFC